MTITYRHGECVEAEKSSVALGTFDGLHIAHAKIINKAAEYAEKNHISLGVMMFDSIPANIVSDSFIPMLMSVEDRVSLLNSADFVYIETFDQKFMSMTPEEFVSYLKNTLKAAFVSVGYNYRFGKGAKGDTKLLKQLCLKEGIEVFVVDKTVLKGEAVSSTRIRELVLAGKVKEAAELLSRPFFINGTVVKGLNNGTKMGIPTANVLPDSKIICPPYGVYAGFCEIKGEKYKSVINVGNNPTFNGKETTIECHLLDFDGDIYGEKLSVHFIDRIRGEIKFPTVDALIEQIRSDIKQTVERTEEN